MNPDRRYVGSPWRARFLRAPKIGFVLAERKDFVRLGSLASVRLGLKTGSDKFFFVKRARLEDERSSKRSLSFARGTVRVTGMNGWTGRIATRDLQPAILNPHQFLREGVRHFVVPAKTEVLYLYPRDRPPAGDLADYVALAEHEGIHERQLVGANASGRRWFRQSRAIVKSRWALPYNSAYEYGALDNHVGAVLNGRFVGVEPLDDVESDLLGAALASTFVLVTRLLEGVATGVEGAFDVGPPAARRVLVPDVRRVPPKRASLIRDVLALMNSENRFPPAPDRRGNVEALRLELDVSVLMALGATRGAASAIAGNVYESYARWRKAVEEVELAMRERRRAMNRSGQSRSVKPSELAARRVWEEMEHDVHLFPGKLGAKVQAATVPANLRMPTQEPLLDRGVVRLQDGESIDYEHYDRLRYAAMWARIGHRGLLPIPTNPVVARRIVDAFVAEEERIKTEARRRARAYVSSGRDLEKIGEAVLRSWLRKCKALSEAEMQRTEPKRTNPSGVRD